MSYEKYQLVILGVLQTRVTYWYTYRLPNTYLPIWLGDLFVYFLLCPTKLLNRICISWPINCAVQVPKNPKPHFANVYFLLYFYSYRNHPLSIFFGNSSFWLQHCIASLQKVCFSLFSLLCALFSLANLKPWTQKKRFLFTDFPFSSSCCCRRRWLKSLIQNIIKIFWSPQIDTLQSVPSLVPSKVKRQRPFSCEISRRCLWMDLNLCASVLQFKYESQFYCLREYHMFQLLIPKQLFKSAFHWVNYSLLIYV